MRAGAPGGPAAERAHAAKAVERAGGLCCLCGRPCGPGDARRHSGPGAFGDGPRHFAPMCGPCRAWVDRDGPPPARYVVHVWHGPGGWWRRAQRVLSGLLLAAAGAAGAVYLGAVAVVLYEAPRGGPWGMLGAGFLLLFLLGAGLRVARGFRGGEETGWADRGLDRRTLRVREER